MRSRAPAGHASRGRYTCSAHAWHPVGPLESALNHAALSRALRSRVSALAHATDARAPPSRRADVSLAAVRALQAGTTATVARLQRASTCSVLSCARALVQPPPDQSCARARRLLPPLDEANSGGRGTARAGPTRGRCAAPSPNLSLARAARESARHVAEAPRFVMTGPHCVYRRTPEYSRGLLGPRGASRGRRGSTAPRGPSGRNHSVPWLVCRAVGPASALSALGTAGHLIF